MKNIFRGRNRAEIFIGDTKVVKIRDVFSCILLQSYTLLTVKKIQHQTNPQINLMLRG